MLSVISPAKTLDLESPLPTAQASQPELLDDATRLIAELRKFSPMDIAEFMDVSMKIAELNFERFQQWSLPFTPENARPAVFAFKGDVYDGLDAYTLNKTQIKFLQAHLRILSGLYGILRPLDLLQPYRLEMGRKLATEHAKHLYEFWGDTLTQILNRELEAQNSEVLINLASNEYFKAIKKRLLHADIITPVFKDWKNGQYKIISFFAKKARGMMVRYIAINRIDRPEGLKDFDLGGYHFDPTLSESNQWVFTRQAAV